MEARDRFANLSVFGAAAVAWVLVVLLVTTRDPRLDPVAGMVGAGLMGAALGLTMVPLFWLWAFARHHRIAYRGDWLRASRRGLWVAVVVSLFVALRLQGTFSIPIGIFVVALVLVSEATLSIDR